MIWKWADRKDNNFPTFHHEHARIEALEVDFAVLCKELLTFVQSIDPGATYISDPLQKIIEIRLQTTIKIREDASAQK